MFNYDHVDYTEMSVEQLGTIRDFAMLKLEAISEAMKARVRLEYEEGADISTLAKKARVSHQMITAWVK